MVRAQNFPFDPRASAGAARPHSRESWSHLARLVCCLAWESANDYYLGALHTFNERASPDYQLLLDIGTRDPRE